VPGLSDNIRVISIVGRYLEHSRLYYFLNNGAEEIYLSSADLMPRNLYRRVEIAFPLEDENLKQYLMKTLVNVTLKDNVKARVLMPNGKYIQPEVAEGAKRINAQEWLMNYAEKENKKKITQKITSAP
ncbi:MAG: RNA degradosome polyphosphate kinase, partial [Syntrophothermus sp.]